MTVRCRVVEQNDLSRPPAESVAEVCVYPALPVAMAKRGGRRRDSELVRHEEIVRYSIRCEMRQVAKPECAHRFGLRLIVYLETDVPRVTMPAGSCVLFRDAGVGGDAAVQKIVGKRSDYLGDGCRQQGERPYDRLAKKNVRAGGPRVCGGRRGGNHEEPDAHHADNEFEGLSPGQPLSQI